MLNATKIASDAFCMSFLCRLRVKDPQYKAGMEYAHKELAQLVYYVHSYEKAGFVVTGWSWTTEGENRCLHIHTTPQGTIDESIKHRTEH
jgi:hypothetical protein